MRRQFWVVMTAAVLSVCMCSCKKTQTTGAEVTNEAETTQQTESMISMEVETSGMEEISGTFEISGVSVNGEETATDSRNTKYGNTAGNLINSGIVCEYNGKIYYLNKSDNKKLYVMNTDGSNKAALGNIQGAIELNVNGDYIYYQAGGIYRATLKDGTVETLIEDSCRNMVVTEDTIYYLKADGDTTKIHCMNLDGSDETILCDNIASGLNVSGDRIYYINGSDSGKIYSMNLDGSDDTAFSDSKNVKELLVESGFVYFINGDNGIFRMGKSGKEAEQVSEKSCSNININNAKLFYYNVTDKTLCYAKIDGSDEKVLYSGELNAINVISDWIYFFNKDDFQYYRITKDGNNIEVVE